MVTSKQRTGAADAKVAKSLSASTARPFCFPSLSQHMNQPNSVCTTAASTRDLTNCLVKAKICSHASLDTLYQKIRKRLKDDDAKRLIAAENFWKHYRDANCEAERELYRPGTGATPAYLAYIGAMTRERIKEPRVTYAVKLKHKFPASPRIIAQKIKIS
jgi:uncharacterized protein YecT (DUF1311 family)